MSVSISSSPSYQRRHTALNACSIAVEESSDPAVYTPHFRSSIFAKQVFYHTCFPFSLPFLLCWDGKLLARNMGLLSLKLGDLMGNWGVNVHLFVITAIYMVKWAQNLNIGVSGVELTVAFTLCMVQRVMIAIKYAFMLPVDYEKLRTGNVSQAVRQEEQLLTGWANITTRTALKNMERTVIRMGAHVGLLSVEFKAKDMPFVRSALAPTRKAIVQELQCILRRHEDGDDVASCFHNGHSVLDELVTGMDAAGVPTIPASPSVRGSESKAAGSDGDGDDRAASVAGSDSTHCQVGEHSWAKGYSILRDASRWSEGQLGVGYNKDRGPTSNSVSVVLIALHLLHISRNGGKDDCGMRFLRLEARYVFPAVQIAMLIALRVWVGQPILGYGWWGPILTINVGLILGGWTSITMQFMNVGILDYRRRVVNMRSVGAFLEHSMTTAALQQLQIARKADAAPAAQAASRYGSFRGLLRKGRAVARDTTSESALAVAPDSDVSKLDASAKRPDNRPFHSHSALDSSLLSRGASGLTALAHRIGLGTPRVGSSTVLQASGDRNGSLPLTESTAASGETVPPPSPRSPPRLGSGVTTESADQTDYSTDRDGGSGLSSGAAHQYPPGPPPATHSQRLWRVLCCRRRRLNRLAPADGAAVQPAGTRRRGGKAWRAGAAQSARRGPGARGSAVETDPELAQLLQSVGAGQWDARSLPHMRLDAAHNFTAWLALRRAVNEFGLRYWKRVQMYTSVMASLLLALVAWFVYSSVFWTEHSNTLEVFASVNVAVFCVIWLQMVAHGHSANAQTDVHTARLREVQIGLRDTLSGGCGLRETQFVVPEEVVKVVPIGPHTSAGRNGYTGGTMFSDPLTGSFFHSSLTADTPSSSSHLRASPHPRVVTASTTASASSTESAPAQLAPAAVPPARPHLGSFEEAAANARAESTDVVESASVGPLTRTAADLASRRVGPAALRHAASGLADIAEEEKQAAAASRSAHSEAGAEAAEGMRKSGGVGAAAAAAAAFPSADWLNEPKVDSASGRPRLVPIASRERKQEGGQVVPAIGAGSRTDHGAAAAGAVATATAAASEVAQTTRASHTQWASAESAGAASVDEISDDAEEKDGGDMNGRGLSRRRSSRRRRRSEADTMVEADERRGLLTLRDATEAERVQVGIKGLVPTIFHLESSGALFAVTPAAERRLLEADSVASAVMRSLWADDLQRPVTVLGMRASTNIVRSVVIVLLSGATFLIRAGV